VKFGVTGNYTGTMQPQGRFDYFNTCSGLNIHGTINSVLPGTPCAGSPSGAKAVDVTGPCDTNNGNCSFHMTLTDGGPGNNNSSKTGPIDSICSVTVTGLDKNGQNTTDMDPGGEPLFRGNITVQLPTQ